MTVYADVLICINIFVNYFLLMGTGKIIRVHIKRLRLLVGALAGGLYSLVIFLPDLSNAVSLAMNLAAGAVIITLCFAPFSIKRFLKCFAAFLLANFIFAGFMLALWIFIKPNGMIYNNSVVYFDIDVKALVISTVACYIVLSIISHFTKKTTADNMLLDITLFNKGHIVMTKALLDTGNSLGDGFSDTPVIIANKKTVEKLIDYSLNDYFDGNNALAYIKDKNIRLIPYNTVGGSGFLKAVKIEKIEIAQEGISVSSVLLAQSNSDFSSEEYSVILNENLLNERGKSNERKTQKTVASNKSLSFKK